MSSSPLIIVDSVAFSVSIIISTLAAYRAFTSRRVLATQIYRNRALWTGTLAVILLLFDAWGILLENTSSSVTYGIVPTPGTPEFYGFVVLSAAASAAVFLWIDSTVGVALELDFLHRDAVGWKKLRLLAGAGLVIGTVVAQFATEDWELLVSLVLLVPSAAYMTSALVVGGSRVREETMRKYMKWMGFLVVSLILQLATNVISPYLNFPLAISAYFLYRISNSLLKTAQLSFSDIEASTSVAQPQAGLDQGPKQGPR